MLLSIWWAFWICFFIFWRVQTCVLTDIRDHILINCCWCHVCCNCQFGLLSFITVVNDSPSETFNHCKFCFAIPFSLAFTNSNFGKQFHLELSHLLWILHEKKRHAFAFVQLHLLATSSLVCKQEWAGVVPIWVIACRSDAVSAPTLGGLDLNMVSGYLHSGWLPLVHFATAQLDFVCFSIPMLCWFACNSNFGKQIHLKLSHLLWWKRGMHCALFLCYPFGSFMLWWGAKIILFTVSLWDCLPFETSVDCCLCSLTVVSLHNPKFLNPMLCIMWFEKSFLSWPFGSLFQLFVDFVLFETNFVSLQCPKIWEPFVKWNFVILFLEKTCLF